MMGFAVLCLVLATTAFASTPVDVVCHFETTERPEPSVYVRIPRMNPLAGDISLPTDVATRVRWMAAVESSSTAFVVSDDSVEPIDTNTRHFDADVEALIDGEWTTLPDSFAAIAIHDNDNVIVNIVNLPESITGADHRGDILRVAHSRTFVSHAGDIDAQRRRRRAAAIDDYGEIADDDFVVFWSSHGGDEVVPSPEVLASDHTGHDHNAPGHVHDYKHEHTHLQADGEVAVDGAEAKRDVDDVQAVSYPIRTNIFVARSYLLKYSTATGNTFVRSTTMGGVAVACSSTNAIYCRAVLGNIFFLTTDPIHPSGSSQLYWAEVASATKGLGAFMASKAVTDARFRAFELAIYVHHGDLRGGGVIGDPKASYAGGMAFVGQVCTGLKGASYLAVLDYTGASGVQVTAHETSHQLGALHDVDNPLNKQRACGAGYVMGGTYGGPNALKYSWCTQTNVRAWLLSKTCQCGGVGLPPSSVQPLPDLSSWTSPYVHMITPKRFFDSRLERNIPVGGGRFLEINLYPTLPQTSNGVYLNIIAITPSASGYVSIRRQYGEQGFTPLVYYQTLITQTSLVYVPTVTYSTTSNYIYVYVSASTHLVVEAVAYTSITTGSVMVPVVPSRVVINAAFTANTRRLVSIAKNTDNVTVVPIGATGAMLAVHVTSPTAAAGGATGLVTVSAGTCVTAATTSVSVPVDSTSSNTVLIPINADGTVCVYSSTKTTINIDLVSFTWTNLATAPAGAVAGNVMLSVPRIIYTRGGANTATLTDSAYLGALLPGNDTEARVLRFPITRAAGLTNGPTVAAAATITVSVSSTVNDRGSLTAWPCVVNVSDKASDRPFAAMLYYGAAYTSTVAGRSATSIIPVSSSGHICLYTTRPEHVSVALVAVHRPYAGTGGIEDTAEPLINNVPTPSAFDPDSNVIVEDLAPSGETFAPDHTFEVIETLEPFGSDDPSFDTDPPVTTVPDVVVDINQPDVSSAPAASLNMLVVAITASLI